MDTMSHLPSRSALSITLRLCNPPLAMMGSSTSRLNAPAYSTLRPSLDVHPMLQIIPTSHGTVFMIVARMFAFILRWRVALANMRSSRAGNLPGFSFGFRKPKPLVICK